jgi:16S rRNA (adenine1518-N6/adenine1519-N6)-dimethyltransferase
MNSKEIINILSSEGIRPNKRLGQNFLCNSGMIDRIADAAGIGKDDIVLEIGPGLGILTEKLAGIAGRVIAVEIDSGLAELIKKRLAGIDNVAIIHGDILKISLDEKFTKMISNLPYYCSSEILFRMAIDYSVPELCVMLQKEMAERIVSRPGSKIYGALTASIGLYYSTEILFNIDRRSFYPRPDVVSTFIKMNRTGDIGLSSNEIDLYHKIVKSAFWGRRKTITRSLADSPHISIEKELIASVLGSLGIDPAVRGESLGVDEFKEMAKLICRASGLSN